MQTPLGNLLFLYLIFRRSFCVWRHRSTYLILFNSYMKYKYTQCLALIIILQPSDTHLKGNTTLNKGFQQSLLLVASNTIEIILVPHSALSAQTLESECQGSNLSSFHVCKIGIMLVSTLQGFLKCKYVNKCKMLRIVLCAIAAPQKY